MVTRRSRALAVLVACAGFALAAPAAFAEVRSGEMTDLSGDGAGEPSQDIVSVAARQDTDGEIVVRATMAGDVAAGPPTAFTFGVQEASPSGACTGYGASGSGASATFIGRSDASSGTFYVVSFPLTFEDNGGDAAMTRFGDVIAFRAVGFNTTTRQGLGNPAYNCVTLTVKRPLTPDNVYLGVPQTTYDVLDLPVRLVAEAPPTATPPTATPPTATPPAATSCARPRLRGMSLRAARRALKRAGCQLGRVTRPGRAGRKRKLVVRRAAGSDPVHLVLKAKRRTRGRGSPSAGSRPHRRLRKA